MEPRETRTTPNEEVVGDHSPSDFRVIRVFRGDASERVFQLRERAAVALLQTELSAVSSRETICADRSLPVIGERIRRGSTNEAIVSREIHDAENLRFERVVEPTVAHAEAESIARALALAVEDRVKDGDRAPTGSGDERRIVVAPDLAPKILQIDVEVVAERSIDTHHEKQVGVSLLRIGAGSIAGLHISDFAADTEASESAREIRPENIDRIATALSSFETRAFT